MSKFRKKKQFFIEKFDLNIALLEGTIVGSSTIYATFTR